MGPLRRVPRSIQHAQGSFYHKGTKDGLSDPFPGSEVVVGAQFGARPVDFNHVLKSLHLLKSPKKRIIIISILFKVQ